jgi:hypothetical protein
MGPVPSVEAVEPTQRLDERSERIETMRLKFVVEAI